MANKFILIENFSWLVSQLKAFSDPQYTYKRAGMPSLVGGPRRIYRATNHSTYYTYAKIAKTTKKGRVKVSIGSDAVPCEVWEVTHVPFTDPKLKEKYPAPDTPYTCIVTDRAAIKNGTATRYYVSCNCVDFKTTFEQELITAGYTADDPTLPAATGKKKLAPAICKHLFAVLMKNYASVLATEKAPDPSAVITTAQPTVKAKKQPGAGVSPTVAKPLPSMSDAQLKPLAKALIAATLSHLDKQRQTYDIESYRIRNSKKISDYKFAVRSVGGFGKYGVGFYYCITSVSGPQGRITLRYLDNTDVDKDFATKLFSLFSKDELVALIQDNTTKRPDTLKLHESLSESFIFVPGVYVDENPSILDTVLSFYKDI